MRHLIIILIFMAFIMSMTLYGQETAFQSLIGYNDFGDFYSSDTTVRDIKVNASNRTFFITRYHNSGTDGIIVTFRMNYFDTDNIIHARDIATYYDATLEPQFQDIYYDFALFGNGIAFPKYENNTFRWYYFDPDSEQDSVSPQITLPASNYFYSFIGTSQIDDTYCLVFFKELGSSLVYAYYLDVNAGVLWNCSFSHDAITAEGSFAVMLDETHFALGFYDIENYKVFTMNNQGQNTGMAECIPGYRISLSGTHVPGRLVLTAMSEYSINVFKFENQNITPVVNIPVDFGYWWVPAVADSSGISLLARLGTAFQLNKYAWNGSLLWSDVLSREGYYSSSKDWMDITPTGNVIASFQERYWHEWLLPDGNYWDWQYHNILVKVISDGTTTDNNEEYVHPVSMAVAAYPNPFRDKLTLSFDLKEPLPVVIKVYNIKGQLLKTLDKFEAKAGRNEVVWNVNTDAGVKAGNGVYIIKAHFANEILTKRVILIK